jgi:hypothetical protein
MLEKKVQVFISHISEEQIEATRAKEYLELAFKGHIEVFLASSWASIPPGEDWFNSILDAIERADIMLVLSSGDSVGRPWLQFETGAGWFAKKTKVIPICHKGMTPAALPEPIRRLQAVDINSDTEAEQFRKLAIAIRQVTNLPESPAISVEELALGGGSRETPSLKGWVLRPGSHIGEEIVNVFKVGTVGAPDVARAAKAGLDPNDALYVRLYVEPPNGQFVNAMAIGQVASLLEREDMPGEVVRAKLKLQAVSQTDEQGDRPSPIILVQEVHLRKE